MRNLLLLTEHISTGTEAESMKTDWTWQVGSPDWFLSGWVSNLKCSDTHHNTHFNTHTTLSHWRVLCGSWQSSSSFSLLGDKGLAVCVCVCFCVEEKRRAYWWGRGSRLHPLHPPNHQNFCSEGINQVKEEGESLDYSSNLHHYSFKKKNQAVNSLASSARKQLFIIKEVRLNRFSLASAQKLSFRSSKCCFIVNVPKWKWFGNPAVVCSCGRPKLNFSEKRWYRLLQLQLQGWWTQHYWLVTGLCLFWC